MNREPPNATLNVPLASLISLGVEHWRLSTWLEQRLGGRAAASAVAAPRHALRRMGDFLAQCEIEVRGMDGHPFDAGLAVEVVDTLDTPELPHGTIIVGETVSPLVLWRGEVVKAAEVVTHRGNGA